MGDIIVIFNLNLIKGKVDLKASEFGVPTLRSTLQP